MKIQISQLAVHNHVTVNNDVTNDDIVASELNDPIWHSLEWQIGSFSSEATIWGVDAYIRTSYEHDDQCSFQVIYVIIWE